MTRFGIIAGNGTFPLEVAAAAKAQGYTVIALAHREETLPELARFCDEIAWVEVGQLGTIIQTLVGARVTSAALAGGISRARLKNSFKPDQRALAMLSRIGKFSDDAVLRGVAAEIESEGIEVIDPVERFGLCVASQGLMAGPEVAPQMLDDVNLGFAVARVLGTFDVGQVVAVKNGVVVAVEAVEGTDATLRRAASLAGQGVVVVKASKPNQDLRFDRPAIGPNTIELLSEMKAPVLAVEAGKTLILDRERTFELAQRNGVSLLGHA